MKTVADELRGLAERIDEEATKWAVDGWPKTAREYSAKAAGIRRIAMRCESMVSLDDVEKAVRSVLRERMGSDLFAKRWTAGIMDRIKGGD